VESNSRLYQISTSGQCHLIGTLSPTQFWNGEILQASDGNLWGNFQSGCGFQGGVFAATTTGSIVQNLIFNCMGDGGISTTNPGENGTFWVMDAGLPKPSPSIVNLQPTSGKAGSTVLLQGSHVVGHERGYLQWGERWVPGAHRKLHSGHRPRWRGRRENCGDQCRRHHQEPKGIHRAVA